MNEWPSTLRADFIVFSTHSVHSLCQFPSMASVSMSAQLTNLVLDEVRNLRAQYSTTSPFPVVAGSSSFSSNGSSTASSSSSKFLRVYTSRPGSSKSPASPATSDEREGRKRPFDDEDARGTGNGGGKRQATVVTSSSVAETPVLRYKWVVRF